MNKPYQLTPQEWEEVAGLCAVQESFALEDETEPAAWLASYAYGVRFDYENESPGYVGPLYLLKSAGGPEFAPLVFLRVEGAMIDMDDWLSPSQTKACAPPVCDGETLSWGEFAFECANPSCPNFGREV